MDNEFKETQQVVIPDDNEVKTDYKAFIPLIVAIVGMLSTFATSVLGWEPFPFTSEQVGQSSALLITVIGAVWGWFRNNNVTKYGQKREAVANQAIPKKK